MNIEKIKYSKCPYCKRYGIKALRGIGLNSNYQVKCRYCNKKYRFNWALSFILKICLIVFWGVVGLVVNKHLKVSSMGLMAIVFGSIAIVSFCIIIRFCPIEEEKDK